MKYICRDCRHEFTREKAVNKCPNCGSIYIIPKGFKANLSRKEVRLTIGDRFLYLLFGAIIGFLTYFCWGIVILVKAPAPAVRGAFDIVYYGAALSLVFAFVAGLIGFFLGPTKLANFLEYSGVQIENLTKKSGT